MKRKLFILLVFIYAAMGWGQNVKRPDTYNYNRGIEALQNENYQEALDYLNKELVDNPKNGYAFVWIALLRDNNNEPGRALSAVEKAIQYLPKKDAEFVAFAYSTRAEVYLSLEDTAKAILDYTEAVRLQPEDRSFYMKRADLYFYRADYDLADRDYRKMIALDQGDVVGYMGLGRNLKEQGRHEEAIKQFNQVVRLSPDYSSGYAFRAESYLGLEKWNEATDDMIAALKVDLDQKALYLTENLKEPTFTLMISKLKVQAAKAANEYIWPNIIARMYEKTGQYEKAIRFYDEAIKIDSHASLYYRKAVCQMMLGNYQQAMKDANMAQDMDSTDVEYLALKANLYYDLGDMEAAIEGWDKVLAAAPEYGWGYYRRGWYKYLAGDNDGATEDLSMSIALDPEISYAYVTRGEIYQKQGKRDLAEADFKKAIEIEEAADEYECIFYAYLGLGQNDRAVECLNSMIANDTTDAGNYYEAACLYSRMKDKEMALMYFEKCLEKGYGKFAHIERDFDLDFIRESEQFKALVSKYKAKRQLEAKNDEKQDFGVRRMTTEVPFTREDGVCKVKCKINDLPLHFVFDTGASDVTLSMVEATFMMKNGYLSATDVIGSQRYMDANGDISVGTVINLRKVELNGLQLKNVRSSVVRNQKAPLLLGQSVLGRLGRIEIDNQQQVLKITHTKE